MIGVRTLIVDVAQYLLFALVAVAAIVWLGLGRAGKVRMAAEGLA